MYCHSKRSVAALTALLVPCLGFAADNSSTAEGKAEAGVQTESSGQSNTTIDRVQAAASVVAENVRKDIEKDARNLHYYAAHGITEYSPVHNPKDKALDGEFRSEPKTLNSVTLGVTLMPNTWRLDLSFSHTYKESTEFIKKSFVDLSGNTQNVVGYNEGQEKTSSIKLYTKPLVGKYGSMGIGFRQFKSTFGVEPYAVVKAVDAPNTGNRPNVPLIDDNDAVEDLIGYPRKPGDTFGFGSPKSAWVKITTTTYYATYSVPDDLPYVPRGLGFSVGYSKDDVPIMLERLPRTWGARRFSRAGQHSTRKHAPSFTDWEFFEHSTSSRMVFRS